MHDGFEAGQPAYVIKGRAETGGAPVEVTVTDVHRYTIGVIGWLQAPDLPR